MTKVTVYGIANCDSVKAARKWLDTRGVEYAFHDYKREGAEPAKLKRWIAEMGLDRVLNRRGTTWRKLSEEDKARSEGADAVSLLVQHPSLIKRPVVEHDGGLIVGFKEDEWDATFS